MAAHDHTPFRGIYAIRHIASGKMYIGSAVNINNRWIVHRCSLRLNKHHSRHLQSAWNKYGEDAFVFEVLEAVKDKADLIRVEQQHLDHFQTWQREFGYNVHSRADSGLGKVMSAESRAKISVARKGTTMSAEQRAKLSAINRGKKMSPESVAKTAAAIRGTKRTPEQIEKMRAVRIGQKASLEARANMSAARKGCKRGPMSPEQRAKLSTIAKNRSPDYYASVVESNQRRKGTKATPEHRAKISAAHKGRKQDPEAIARGLATKRERMAGPLGNETRAKLSAAAKRRWAAKRAAHSASHVHIQAMLPFLD